MWFKKRKSKKEFFIYSGWFLLITAISYFLSNGIFNYSPVFKTLTLWQLPFNLAFWRLILASVTGGIGVLLAAFIWEEFLRRTNFNWEDQIDEAGQNYPTGLKIFAKAGHLVRSKEELLISNLLFDSNISYSYEKKLVAENGTYKLPDFTVIDKFGREWHWEHLGMLNDPKYREDWFNKNRWYRDNFPKNLLITVGGKTLASDSQDYISKLLGFGN